MDIKDTRQLLSRIREDVELARRIIEKETSDARMLIDQETQREFADELLAIGDDIATYFGKVGFGNNKMAIIKK